MSQKTILVCFAHPDDETFGPGGTLARYAREGVAVHLACATRGEAGTVDPEFMQGYHSIGDMRWDELMCATRKLGLASVTHLGYRDSGMPGSPDNQHPQSLVSAPEEEVAGKLVRLIRELRPQVLITFDPTGGYYHPDHIAIHKATVRAFEAAGDSLRHPQAGSPFAPAGPPFVPARLYYHTIPHPALKWAVRLLPLLGQDPARFGRNQDIDLTKLVADELPPTTVIRTRKYAGVKSRASACHRSQLEGGPPWFMRLSLRLMGRHETFVRAQPPFDGAARETDLFQGLRLD